MRAEMLSFENVQSIVQNVESILHFILPKKGVGWCRGLQDFLYILDFHFFYMKGIENPSPPYTLFKNVQSTEQNV